MGVLVASMVVSIATVAFAGVPSLTLSSAVSAETNPVSVYSMPNGAGDGLANCYLYGGAPANATITLTLVDGTPNPINLYPFEDMWIASADGGLVACPGGTVADGGSTNAAGQTTWTGAFNAGGWSDQAAGAAVAGAIIIINGDALTQAPLPIYFNSADITGDLVVDISDVTVFAGDYFGVAAYRSDFYWDGTMDVSDVVKLAPAFGTACP
jgi:hypothetical protein